LNAGIGLCIARIGMGSSRSDLCCDRIRQWMAIVDASTRPSRRHGLYLTMQTKVNDDKRTQDSDTRQPTKRHKKKSFGRDRSPNCLFSSIKPTVKMDDAPTNQQKRPTTNKRTCQRVKTKDRTERSHAHCGDKSPRSVKRNKGKRGKNARHQRQG
jgi:hypothetical protein